MKRRTDVAFTDAPQTVYTRKYWICKPGYSYDHALESARTEEEAVEKAKKYVHLHKVIIEEELKRTVLVLPERPVCT